jgi:hypothetical protein
MIKDSFQFITESPVSQTVIGRPPDGLCTTGFLLRSEANASAREYVNSYILFI